MTVSPASVPGAVGAAEPGGSASLVALPGARRSRRSSALRRLLHTPSAVVGLAIVIFWVFCAIFWPLFAPYSPDVSHFDALLAKPSATYLFGTDQLGRDVFSRVLAGSREVLVLAPAATMIGLIG